MIRKHLLLMVIGCIVPILALAAVFLFQIPIGTVFLFGLFLLCPALHLWMMRDHAGHSTRLPEHTNVQGPSGDTMGQQPASTGE